MFNKLNISSPRLIVLSTGSGVSLPVRFRSGLHTHRVGRYSPANSVAVCLHPM